MSDTQPTETDTTTNQSDTGTSQSNTGTNQSDTGTSQSDTGTSQSGTSSWSWGWGSITSTLSSAVTKATELTSSVINKGGEEEVPTPQEMTRESHTDTDSDTDTDKGDQTIGGIFTGLATAVQSTVMNTLI